MADKKGFFDWDNVTYAGRNELVFADRNREYGAFYIRKEYSRTVVRAVIFSIVFLTFLLLVPTIIAYLESLKPVEKNLKDDNTVELMDAPPMDENEPPPPPVEPPPPVQETIKFVPPVVTNEEVKEEDIPPPVEELKESNAGVVTQEGTLDAVDLPTENKAIEDKPEEIFTYVEEMPKFPGGEEELMKYLGKNINYPALEKENGISGTAYVFFVINKSGEVEDASIKRGVKGGPGLDKEALRVIKGMPKWSIGMNNGRAAKVSFVLPVKFVLR